MNKCFLTIALALTATAGVSAQQSYTAKTPDGRQVTLSGYNGAYKVSNAPVGAVMPDSKLIMPISDMEADKLYQTKVDSNWLSTDGSVSIVIDNKCEAPGTMIIHDSGKRDIVDGRQVITLQVPKGGIWRGGGERGHSLDLTGDTLVMYNRPTYGYSAGESRINQMNITMPLILSTNGYAILFDDYAAAQLIVDDGRLTYVTENPQPVSYYVVTDNFDCSGTPTVASLVAATSNLIGVQPMAPLWTLGYITSKYGYKSSAETREVVNRLKADGYPLDGIVLDLYWYGVEQDMGRLDWDKDGWADYKEMLAELNSNHVNLLSISQPYVLRNGRGIDNYNFLAQNSMLVPDSLGRPGEVKIWVGEGGMLDVSNPATRSWLIDLYSRQKADGVAGMWGDLGEPEMHPDSLIHYNGLPARLYHNVYGNDWASIISEMMRRDYSGQRYMTLMRGGTIGLQRESVFPWSGDVSRSWGGLQAQLPIMINSGLSGLGYMHHDVGGFAVDPANPIDPELYIRWMQLGLYSPILRTHAQEAAEPFNYPEYQDILLPIVKERYRWLPYNYSMAIANNLNGSPLVRPVDYFNSSIMSADPNITDQYLWGDNVMIAPVLQPGMESRKVVFPAISGSSWVDIDNPTKVYAGGTVAEVKTPLNRIPRFVVAGSAIPMAEYEMTSTADYRPDDVTINVYYAPDTKYYSSWMTDDLTSLYNDDNSVVTNSLLFYSASKKSCQLTYSSEGVTQPVDKTIKFKVHGLKKKPKKVVASTNYINKTLCDKQLFTPLDWNYDKTTGQLTFDANTTIGPEFLDIIINIYF